MSDKRKGFTLVELLVVIAVIAILFIVLISKVNFASDKAKDAGVLTDFRSYQIGVNNTFRENNIDPLMDEESFVKYLNKNLDKKLRCYEVTIDGDSEYRSTAVNPYGFRYVFQKNEEELRVYSIKQQGNDLEKLIQSQNTVYADSPKVYSSGKVMIWGSFEEEPEVSDIDPEKHILLPQDKVVDVEDGVNTAPKAVITMNEEEAITVDTVITWDHTHSIASEGRSIVDYEWRIDGIVTKNPNGTLIIGDHIMELRVQDSEGEWSTWVEKAIVVLPGVWTDKTYGGTGVETVSCVLAVEGGGYILAGTTSSAKSGDVSKRTNGGADFWVLKITESGEKVWDKTYGGSGNEAPGGIVKASDGGYVISGVTASFAGGDVTKGKVGQGSDAWILKINEDGSKVWDKTYGGIQDERMYGMLGTSDGGYIVIGYTFKGSSGGDVTRVSYGVTNMWILKVDVNGDKEWDKTYGGYTSTSFECANEIVEASDGGYLLVGYTESTQGGNVSKGTNGGRDIWIVKIDEDGTKLWDKTYGGNRTDEATKVIATEDGGYIIFGNTNSFAAAQYGGDVTVGSYWMGCWTFKIDQAGEMVWDKTYAGGAYDDYILDAVKTPDGGYIMVGHTKSYIDEGALRFSNFWVLKINSEGTLIKNRYHGGPRDDWATSIVASASGGYLVSGYTNSHVEDNMYDLMLIKIDGDGVKY